MGAISDAESDSNSVNVVFKKDVNPNNLISKKSALQTLIFLCIINLLNYIDRFTLISVLDKVKDELNISSFDQGLVSTIFIISYMLISPLAGYLGDKHSRKLLITAGVLVWILSLVLAYMIPEVSAEDQKSPAQTPSQESTFNKLLATRTLFGIGEAAYMAVAPGIIHDVYCDDSSRNYALLVFNGMIPIGGGMGFILPSLLPEKFANWRFSMVMTAPVSILVIVFFVLRFRDVPHGYSDLINQAGNNQSLKKFKSPPWSETIKGFWKNSTYKYTVIGFTCVCYIMGAGSVHLPLLFKYGGQINSGSEEYEDTFDGLKMKFGAITTATGMVGCIMGGLLSDRWKTIGNPRADSDVCAIGMLVGALFLYTSLIFSGKNQNISLLLYAFGATGINFNWALTVKMVMDVVRPNEKSTANAFLTLVAHTFGDAFSPPLLGFVADKVAVYLVNNDDEFKMFKKEDPTVMYHALQQPLMSMALIAACGAVFFFLASVYIVEDSQAKSHHELEQSDSETDRPGKLQTTAFTDSGQESDNLKSVIYRRASGDHPNTDNPKSNREVPPPL